MKNKQPSIGAIDIGSTHVSVVVGEQIDRNVQVLGYTRMRNASCRRGAIINFGALTDVISDAIDEVERQTGIELLRVRVSVSGSQSLSENIMTESGLIKTGEVSVADVENYLSFLGREKATLSNECIHRLLCYFKVDDLSFVQSPLGLTGTTLASRMHRVMVQHSEAINLIKACNQCGLRVDGFAFEPLAIAECVLDADEKEMGALSIGLGFEQTHVALYNDGYPVFSKVYGVGSNHISKDLSVGLRTTLTEAERIKRDYGHACSGGYEGLDKIVMVGTNNVQRFINRNEVVRIINPRVQEIFEKIQCDLQAAGLSDLLPKGVVLSGGGAQLRGLCIVSEEIFGHSARVALPTNIGGLVEGLRSPMSTTLIGMMSPMFSNIFGERNCVSLPNESLPVPSSFLESFKRFIRRDGNGSRISKN